MNSRSTEEIAKLAGVSKMTIERWIADGKIPMPKQVQVGVRKFRLWTDRDVKRVKAYKAKFYCKGRGRKKQS